MNSSIANFAEQNYKYYGNSNEQPFATEIVEIIATSVLDYLFSELQAKTFKSKLAEVSVRVGVVGTGVAVIVGVGALTLVVIDKK